MGKLVKLILVIAIVAVAAYALITFTGTSGNRGRTASDQPDDERPRVEEKYGFTSETVGD